MDPSRPYHDSLPDYSEPTWVPIPLGDGQEDSPRAHLEFTHDGDPLRGTDVRRAEGYEHLHVVHRWPWAPA